MNIILLCRSVWWWGRVVIVISGAKSGGLAHVHMLYTETGNNLTTNSTCS